MSGEILTLEAVTNIFSRGLPQDQWDANHAWVKQNYRLLKEGGRLGVPATGQVFEKKYEGFVEIKF
jgi:hypothetical protein